MEPAGVLGLHITVRARDEAINVGALPSKVESDFTEFYEQEFTRTARFAWLLVRSPAVAEDLAQEAFVVLSGQFEQVENPCAFLHRVLVCEGKWMTMTGVDEDFEARLTRVLTVGAERLLGTGN